jgi:hypothetical protein
MPPKSNPLGLNNLQLKTLALFQELARHPETSSRKVDTGEVLISNMPNPHGNHFHLGSAIVFARDATGLRNPAVWAALDRKGLAKAAFPIAITLTPAGLAYDVGAARNILHGADH